MQYRYLTGERVTFEPVVDTLVGIHTPYCWGCGPEAEHGLALRPRLEGSEVVADLEFAQRFEGGPGTVHGGAVAALLDDLLGYVCMAHGAPVVTARLDTSFIAPVPVGVSVRGTAWLTRVEGRKMWSEGTVEIDGRVLVEASALFLVIDTEHFDKVFDSYTDEQKERYTAYRSGDSNS